MPFYTKFRTAPQKSAEPSFFQKKQISPLLPSPAGPSRRPLLEDHETIILFPKTSFSYFCVLKTGQFPYTHEIFSVERVRARTGYRFLPKPNDGKRARTHFDDAHTRRNLSCRMPTIPAGYLLRPLRNRTPYPSRFIKSETATSPYHPSR